MAAVTSCENTPYLFHQGGPATDEKDSFSRLEPLVTRVAIFFPRSLNELKKEALPVVQCFYSLLLQNRAAFEQKTRKF